MGGSRTLRTRPQAGLRSRPMDKAHLLIVRHCPQVVSSVLPTVMLPKCPVCIAAYIAMVTGIGLSLPVTAHLRTLLVVLCATSLIYFVARQIHRRFALRASSSSQLNRLSQWRNHLARKKESHVKAKARPQAPGTKDDCSRQQDPNQPSWYHIHPGWRSRASAGVLPRQARVREASGRRGQALD